MKYLIYFWQNCRGATAIEYSLLVAGIAIAIIGSIYLHSGGDLGYHFRDIAETI